MRCAILSGADDEEEVMFDDLERSLGINEPGYAKVWFCANQASKDGLEYFE